MNIEVSEMFSERGRLLKKLTKHVYEDNMKYFHEKYGVFFTNLVMSVVENDDVSNIKGLCNAFSIKTKRAFKDEHERVKPSIQAELNLFMVYYVFPEILSNNTGYEEKICNSLCTAWNSVFPKSNIGYVDYDTLYNSFKTGILGLLLGK